jgi:hypothetical protein
MKTNHLLLSPILALICVYVLCPSALLGQGSLTPPGGPMPSMKTLTQIEPRIAITNAGAVVISVPGSYYLTTNITVNADDAVIIAASGTTLDLNGFTISSSSASASGSGIVLNLGLQDITILNGHIRGGVTNNGSGGYSGPGFQRGIYYVGGTYSTHLRNVRVAGVSVSGCAAGGIDLFWADLALVEGCTVQSVGQIGIKASLIKHSIASDCGSTGIYGEAVYDSQGSSNGSGVSAVTAQDCSGTSWSSADGLHVSTTAQNCFGSSNTGRGLSANTALNCRGSSTGGMGLSADVAQNCEGYSYSNIGMVATNATGCRGESGGDYYGLYAVTASNCSGKSIGGVGLQAATAQNCFGQSSSTYGLLAELATGCQGKSTSNPGLRFTKAGSMCWGERASPAGTNYVLGAGMVGPVSLP